jgi:tetratricopeptide (TPR) repeat protein
VSTFCNPSRRSAWRVPARRFRDLCSVAVCLGAQVFAFPGAVPDIRVLDKAALQEFESAVRDQISRAYDQAARNPREAAASGKLGMLFQLYGKYDLAENWYTRARALDPASFRWTYYLGVVASLLGNNRAAIEHIREAVRLDPGYAPAQIRLAQALFDSGEAEQSLALYRTVIARNDRLATAYFGLGQVLAARTDWPAAIDAYRRACEISEDYAAAQYALAMAYRRTGDMQAARHRLEKYQKAKQARQPVEDRFLDDVQSLYAGGLTHVANGSTLYAQGKLQESAAEFESAIQVNPRLIAAHINLIAIYGRLNRTDKAEQHFRAALDVDPGWVEVYYNWGLCLAEHGRKQEARQMFQKAVAINPRYADAHVQLASLLDDSGDPESAAGHYRQALRAEPNNRQAHYLFARNLVRTGHLDAAIDHLRQTVEIDDERTPACMHALALAYERSGNLEQTRHYLREAYRRATSLGLNDLAAQLRADLDRTRTDP